MADEIVNDVESAAIGGSVAEALATDGTSDSAADSATYAGPPADDLVVVATQDSATAQIVSDAVSDVPAPAAPAYPVAAPVAPVAATPDAPESEVEVVTKALSAIRTDAKSRGWRTLAQGAAVSALMSAGGVVVGYLHSGGISHMDYVLIGTSVAQALGGSVAAYLHRVVGLSASAE